MLLRTPKGVCVKVWTDKSYAMIHIGLKGNAEHYEGDETLSATAIAIWDSEYRGEYEARREWAILDGSLWTVDRMVSYLYPRVTEFVLDVRTVHKE